MKSILLLVCFLSAALAAPVNLSRYPHTMVLRKNASGDVYTLYWGSDAKEQTMRFAVHVNTTGWVGFGLSPTGNMSMSDVVIGWVNDDGKAFFHVSWKSLPPKM